MKIIFVAVIAVFCSVLCTVANAKMYKCTLDDKVSYQDVPCEETGSSGHIFEKKADISKKQQRKAKLKLDLEAARAAEQEQLEQEADDQERLIRAEEEKAFAAQQYAEQVRRQAEALEERNDIESRKRNVVYDRWNYNPRVNGSNENHDHKYEQKAQPVRPFVNNRHNSDTVVYPNKTTNSKHAKHRSNSGTVIYPKKEMDSVNNKHTKTKP